MATDTTLNLAIIGGGPGGYVAAIRAAQLGMEVALIERDELGGICLNWGCIPTKALLKNAELYLELKRGSEYGLKFDNLSFDFSKIIRRSSQVADRLSKGVGFLMKKNKITVLNGSARLVGEGEIEVTDEAGKTSAVRAKHIILATGGHPRTLPGVTIDEKKVISSSKAISLSEVPKSLCIIGAGPIGIEFAYFYAALGSTVTVIEMLPHILPLEDEEVAQVVASSLKKQGVKIHTDTKVASVDTSKDLVTVSATRGDEELEVTAELALMGVGIAGNVDGLGLDERGVKVENGFVAVNERYETSASGIYAVGDLIGPPLLAHVASAEGIATVEALTGHDGTGVDYDLIPSCTYCQPQVASVGLTEKAALEGGREIKVGRFPFRANGKSLALGEHEGLVKLVFDAEYGELLGAHIVGIDATEQIAELCMAKKLEATYKEIMNTVHAHPTLSEAVMEAAADAFDGAIHI